MRRLIGKRGKGGGHGMMAGGWVSHERAPGGDPALLEHHLTRRLAKYLKKSPDRLKRIGLGAVQES